MLMAESLNFITNGVTVGTDRRVDPGSVSPEILESLEEFNHFYEASPDEFWAKIYNSQKRDHRFGQPYFWLRQRGDSKTHVAVTQPPYATNVLVREGNPNSYNTVIKNMLLDFTNRRRGLTDPAGNYISTLVIGASDRDYSQHFDPLSHLKLARGDFSPYAKRILGAMKRKGFEAGLIYGYSRASAVGSFVLRNAARQNMDAVGAVLVELTDAKKQNTLSFVRGYLGNYAPGNRPAEVSGHWWNDGPQVMLDLQHQHGDGSYLTNFLRPGTLPTIRGMARDKLIGNIKYAMDMGHPVVLGYGENSGIAHDVGETVANDEQLLDFVSKGLLEVMRIRGAGSGHDFGEDHLAYTATFSDGLLFVNNYSRE